MGALKSSTASSSLSFENSATLSCLEIASTPPSPPLALTLGRAPRLSLSPSPAVPKMGLMIHFLTRGAISKGFEAQREGRDRSLGICRCGVRSVDGKKQGKLAAHLLARVLSQPMMSPRHKDCRWFQILFSYPSRQYETILDLRNEVNADSSGV